MAWIKALTGAAAEPTYKYIVQDGVAQQPYTGGGTQYSNYIEIYRNADNSVNRSFLTSVDVTNYRYCSIKYSNASPNAATVGTYCGSVFKQMGGLDPTTGTVTHDISALTGIQNIGCGPYLNSSSWRLTEIVLIK